MAMNRRTEKDTPIPTAVVVAPYACQRVTIDSQNKNRNLTEILERMEKYYWTVGDNSRQLAHRRAIAVLKSLTSPVKNGEDLKNVQYIGEKMIAKVNEILCTGTLGVLKTMMDQEYMNTMNAFTGIHGVGPAMAKRSVLSRCHHV